MDYALSVVVVTYNSMELLRRTLDSLCHQTTSALFEVVVVDDGSADGSRDLALGYASRLHLTYLFQPDYGFRVAAARNMGIQRARADVILFLDAGILVGSRLIEMHIQRHREGASRAVLGMSYGVFEHENLHVDLLESQIDEDVDASLERLARFASLRDCRDGFLRRIRFGMESLRSPWLLFWTGHVSVSTNLLRCVSGFDEWFNRWGGEDVELGIRLAQAGCQFEFLEKVFSIHYPHTKNAGSKRADSHFNVRYIHAKHALEDTRRLLTEGWESILTSEVTMHEPVSTGTGAVLPPRAFA